MKIEKTSYVIMRIGDVEFSKETAYLTSDYKFTNDSYEATKAANRRTALEIKHDYEVTEHNSYESDLKIVPLKVTYEW